MKKLIRMMDKLSSDIPVSEIMVRDVITLREEEPVQKVIDLMSKHSISGIIITDEHEKPIGIISEGDLLKKVFSKKRDPQKVKIREIMSKNLYYVKAAAGIPRVIRLMRKKKISKIPVMDKNKIVGYVTKSDLLESMMDLYKHNRRLIWLTVFMVVELIIIAVLVLHILK